MSTQASQIADSFYSAFSRRDADSMNAYYTEDVHFSDPIFPSLGTSETRAMWKMLCKNAKDFSLTYSVLESGPDFIQVEWNAKYIFSSTGRPVEDCPH